MISFEGADDKFGIACLGGECFGEAGCGFLRFSCAEPNDRLATAGWISCRPLSLERTRCRLPRKTPRIPPDGGVLSPAPTVPRVSQSRYGVLFLPAAGVGAGFVVGCGVAGGLGGELAAGLVAAATGGVGALTGALVAAGFCSALGGACSGVAGFVVDPLAASRAARHRVANNSYVARRVVLRDRSQQLVHLLHGQRVLAGFRQRETAEKSRLRDPFACHFRDNAANTRPTFPTAGSSMFC